MLYAYDYLCRLTKGYVWLCIIESASEVQRSVLLSEGLMLAGLTHEQLLGVIGVLVSPPHLPPAVILPATTHGNLKRLVKHISFVVNSVR